MEGFLYCLSHAEGSYKVGMTLDEQFIKNVQKMYLSSLEHEFVCPKIEFYKKVFNPKNKKDKIHDALKNYDENGYYRIHLSEIQKIFDFFDDFNEIETVKNDVIDDDENIINDVIDFTNKQKNKAERKYLKDYVHDGQEIRHVRKKDKCVWTCIYNLEKNRLVQNLDVIEIEYETLNDFVKKNNNIFAGSAWDACEVKINDGEWVYAKKLQKKINA